MKQRVATRRYKRKKKVFNNRRRYDVDERPLPEEDPSSSSSHQPQNLGLALVGQQQSQDRHEISISNALASSTPLRSAASISRNESSHGNNTTLEGSINESGSRSKQKLGNSSLLSIIQQQTGTKQNPITRRRAKLLDLKERKSRLVEPSGMSIIDTKILADAIRSSAICKNCKSPSTLTLMKDTSMKRGLAEHFHLMCSICESSTKFSSSNRTKNDKCYEVNLRSVNASLPIGHAGLSKFCTKMNLPQPVTSKPYTYLSRKLEKSGETSAEIIMKEAADRLCKKIMEEGPGDCEVDEDGRIFANVAVTVDGTWQKRGHSSKIGVVFVISVLTGEILDFEVKSLFCHACQQKSTLDRNSKEYKDWMAVHEKDCCCNFEGSSGEMEVKGAMDIFSRSIESRHLHRVPCSLGKKKA